MNNTTATFNTYIKKAYENIELITAPAEKATAICALLSALAQTGAVEVQYVMAPANAEGQTSNREQLENRPNAAQRPVTPVHTPATQVTAAPAAAPAAAAAVQVAATAAPATAQAAPAAASQNITSAQLADTWTPEMIEMFKQTYSQVLNFLGQGLKVGAFNQQWISEQLRICSGGKITLFENMNSIPPRFIKVFASFLAKAWAEMQQKQVA